MVSWLKNGILALAIAGIYSIILVLLRVPHLSFMLNDGRWLFKPALVVHVNLSVLVWLLSITASIWSILLVKSGLERIYVKLCGISIAIIALSPLISEPVAFMNNYIPMMANIAFIIGLSLFGTVILCFALQTLIFSVGALFFLPYAVVSYADRIIKIVQITSALLFCGVWVCFTLSYLQIENIKNIVPLELDYYYEMLFWSGGHLLQFLYTQIFMFILLLLVEAYKRGKIEYANIYEMLFFLNFILAVILFWGHFNFDIYDGSFKEFFTQHMIYTCGLIPTIFILLLSFELIKWRIIQNTSKVNIMPYFVLYSYLASVLLFLAGGIIGICISGYDVTIPAHYHGSIVGISIAFMGFAYLICFKEQINNKLSNNGGLISYIYNLMPDVKNTSFSKAPTIQICLITFGQLMHIGGLALAGGYGVMRKDTGTQMSAIAKFYMGMVGTGGVIAIIGGLMFVYIYTKCFLRK